ncbi:MAG: flagellar protein FlgN [Verrucomicrobiota bacterium]|nr:flagellar protein FlgN [Limisphaera sp.]MDW8381524.1 flagellar protein FlgN [Verrucomicrobiota bacterium]
MNVALQQLIEALRQELQQYGEMLALLEQQQDGVLHRRAEQLLQTVDAIQAQARVLQQAREHRETCRGALARALGLSESVGLSDLIPHLPAEYRPLLEALIQENNDLLVRVQQRARQNHLLLHRAVELMQKLIAACLPGSTPQTYNGQGQVPSAQPWPTSTLLNAIG